MNSFSGILDTEPYVPQVHILPPKKAQERGRGRGKILIHSSNESVDSSKLFTRGNQSNVPKDISLNSSNSFLNASDSEEIKGPTYQKLISSPSPQPKNNRWATLVPDRFNEVDIGEFYTPDRFYVLLASHFRAWCVLLRV